MIKEASAAIESMSERERAARKRKYAKRNRMRYIDRLLNELEMLNLADRRELPPPLAVEVWRVIAEADEPAEAGRPESVPAAMDVLYDIQDTLMENPIGDE